MPDAGSDGPLTSDPIGDEAGGDVGPGRWAPAIRARLERVPGGRVTAEASLDVPPYADASYVASLAHAGEPVRLAASGGWLISREVPGTGGRDLTGPYPLLSCTNWHALPEDLAVVDEDVLS